MKPSVSSAREGCVRSPTYRIRKESLLYGLAVDFDGLRGVTNQSVVLVVSPLVALMADQVAQCCSCAVAPYVMLYQCGCRLRNQTFLENKSRIGNSPGLLLSREGVAPRGPLVAASLALGPLQRASPKSRRFHGLAV